MGARLVPAQRWIAIERASALLIGGMVWMAVVDRRTEPMGNEP